MDHTQELDMIVVDAVLDKVEVALGLSPSSRAPTA
jgi:hypothetical protein